MRRILTAAVLLPLFWLLVKQAPPWVFYAVAASALARAVWECLVLLERTPARPFKLLGVAGSLAVLVSFLKLGPSFPAILPVFVVLVVAMCSSLWIREEPAAMLGAALGTLFAVVFVGVALSYAVALRGFPGEDGQDLLMLLLGCVIAADTAAYYVGSTFGRRRLAPRVSPKKSWEGALGGVAASIGAALVAHFWFFQRLPLGHAAVLGLLLALASILGDLSASVVKRSAGAKDASKLLPGHGGMLDRADSLLFAGPLLYYYYLWALGGGAGGLG
jgi:phosphatidate cytidylyltransferase